MTQFQHVDISTICTFLLVYHQSDVQQCTGFSWYWRSQRNDGNQGCDLGLSTKSFKELKKRAGNDCVTWRKGASSLPPKPTLGWPRVGMPAVLVWGRRHTWQCMPSVARKGCGRKETTRGYGSLSPPKAPSKPKLKGRQGRAWKSGIPKIESIMRKLKSFKTNWTSKTRF